MQAKLSYVGGVKKNNAAVTSIISFILALLIVTSAIASIAAGATFGYETEGGSGLYIGYADIDQIGSYRRGTTYSPDYDGTLVSMRAFIQRPDDGSYSYKLTLAIFEEDGWGADSHKLIEEHTTGWILTSGWVDITGFSQSITAGENYILAACAEVTYPVYEPVTINLGYDDVGTNRYYEEPVLSSGFPDREPWNLAETGTGRKHSIYCTYTPSNNAPTQSGEIPANTSTGISVTPQLYVLCKDNDADNMNATWWSNSSGSWVQFASNWTSFANNTNITQPFTNASAYNTTYYWSVNLTDGTDWTNETFWFVTESNVAPWIKNPNPNNGSTGQNRQPICNVTVVDNNSDSMTVYFYENTTGSWVLQQTNSSVSNNTNVVWNSYSNASSYNTKYWWSVNCSDGTDWCNETYHFTTAANNPPNAPTSPECDNQTNPDHVLDHTPYFDWVFSDPDGGDTQEGFHIQVGNDTDWGVVERWDNNQSSNTNSYTTYSGSTLYDGDTYYWRVKTKDNKSVWGSWISNQNFRMNSVPTAPNLNSPANNSYHMPYTTESINLIWATSTDAESDSLNYEWQYAEDSAFSVDEVHGWSGGPLYKLIPTAGNLDMSTDYYWHIRAWDGLEYGSYSVWRTFTTDDNMAPTQTGESPTNQSTGVSLTPALYVICNDADGDILTATWRSNSSGGWVDFATNTSISPGTNITQTNSNFSEYNATYYWSVNATDGISWTNETYHFTTESEDTPDGNGGTPDGNGGDGANTAPTADADGSYTGYVGQIITFNGTNSSDPNSDTLTYTWDFGDGNNGTGATPTHAYISTGLYNVTLTVSDGSLSHNDTTTANISELPVEPDSDGDGWSDEIEQSYETNITDPNDHPLDTDDDGIPDEDSPDGKYTGDLDDDNDGLDDEIEQELGSNSNNASDVKNIDDNITGGYLVDTNGDGTYDKFYNSTSGINTTTKLEDDGTYKIDTNGDGTWDYIYDPASGAVTPCKPEEEFPWLLAIIAIVVIIGILFLQDIFVSRRISREK